MSIFSLATSIQPLRWILGQLFTPQNGDQSREILGLKFKNPVGLAAGFDKDGKYITAMSTLGFGFVEVGTVTPKPQAGNPKPRLFRLKASRGLINRMGFNNGGVDALVEKLKENRKRNVIVGGNIGKNKMTPNENALDDYMYCFNQLFDHVDYFVVNVSSPNTPDLRSLQDKEPLTKLLSALLEENRSRKKQKPLLLKIAPDLNQAQLDDIIEITKILNLDGLIATNTTISRSGLQESEVTVESFGNGGLSGAPLAERSTEVIRYLRDKLGEGPVIIGVGGIHDYQTAKEKMDAGANLIQIYSGLIYEGPGLVKRIVKGL